ncbi:hypothetical protein F0Q45_13775 [Mycobacterium simiae]|uniref:Mce protein n=1 Tax=Mycobacterium simiae TaxID=1784 RepID=A0A5B1BM52_MYCSI|nr:hypothetical protein [Mycobacterium simiae]KAA1249687.1 hypothetical protein F0Q45_13775 [Mycobacterium simiae]
MAKSNEPRPDSASSKAEAMAMAAQAEAEAAEAEALAAAARARARAAQLKREAMALAEANDEEDRAEYGDDEYEYEYEYDYEDFVVANGVAAEAEDQEIMQTASWRGRSWGWLRARLPAVAKAAAVLIICGFAGLSGFIVWQHYQATERQQRATAFAAGARKGVISMISLDFSKAKEDVQRVIDSSTGEFKDEFQARAADFIKVVEQSKVVTEGTVNATAVESMDGRNALVLVSATSHVTNAGNGKDEPRVWRLRVTVTEEDGQYKMSKVEFVP